MVFLCRWSLTIADEYPPDPSASTAAGMILAAEKARITAEAVAKGLVFARSTVGVSHL
jgi:hypothetical protein